MRVQLHGLADHVGDLVEAGRRRIVEQRVQHAPLHRLAAVAQVGDRAIQDGVAGVLEEVAPHQRLEIRHPTGHVVEQVVDDEVAPLGRVLAHEELEARATSPMLAERHRHEPDVGADELAELVGADLAEALEARDLGLAA